MACNSLRLGSWNRVPDHCELVLCVEPGEGSTDECFDASAIFDANVPPAVDKSWDHGELTACTIREPLLVPTVYVVTVTIAFQGADACSAVVRAHIESPNDGGPLEKKYCRVVSSDGGAVQRCHLLIIMSLS